MYDEAIKNALENLRKTEEPAFEDVKAALNNLSGDIVALHHGGYSINQIVNAVCKCGLFISSDIVHKEIERILREDEGM